MNKIFSVMFICTILCSIHCFANENAFLTDPIGLVVSLRGQAVAVNADGQERTLSIKSKVFRGDNIRTGPTARVQILFDDNTAISLGSGSKMSLREYDYRPELKQAKFRTRVEQGDFQVKAGDTATIAPDKFVTETPLGSIGIRGSMYFGSLRDGNLRAMLLGGTGIYFQSAAGTVDIRTIGQGIDLPAGFTGLPDLKKFSPSEIQQMKQAVGGGNNPSNASGSSESTDGADSSNSGEANSDSLTDSGGGVGGVAANAVTAGSASGGNAVQPTFDARTYIEQELASLMNQGTPDPSMPSEPSILYPGRLLPYSGKDGVAEGSYINWNQADPFGGWEDIGTYADVSLIPPDLSGIAQYSGAAFTQGTNNDLVELDTYVGTTLLNFNLQSRTIGGEVTGLSATGDTVRWDFNNIKIDSALKYQINYPTFPASGSLDFYYNGVGQPTFTNSMSGTFFGSTNNAIPAAAVGAIVSHDYPTYIFYSFWGADYIKYIQ